MALIKKPVTGMKDILPEEMVLRDYLMDIIKTTYRSFGFMAIDTPVMEHIENLLSKQGGDNEKLIFKILKRGEKLDVASATKDEDVVDGGLRYDLTLPLARYFSNNQANLIAPFKALQIGNVFRADRPQKGRFRQFTQCDIDILGEESNLAEIELISATTLALSRICPDNKFSVRINDRQILKAMAAYASFPEEETDKVFIILDKMDKIGLEGVKSELLEAGFKKEGVDRYVSLFESLGNDENTVLSLKEVLKGFIEEEKIDNLYEIMATVKASTEDDFELIFDATLVRGMGYYTGTIFEVSMEGFSGSVAGGGRYDKMIGKFTGNNTPACGFSIGFERIITILMDRNFKPETKAIKKAYLFEKGIDTTKLSEVFSEAMEERKNGNIVIVAKMNKNKKFQKQQLLDLGYTDFVEFYKEELK